MAPRAVLPAARTPARSARSGCHREPLTASRSRPARRDERKKVAHGRDHAEAAYGGPAALTLLCLGLLSGSSPGFSSPEGPRVATATKHCRSLTQFPVYFLPPFGATCKRLYLFVGSFSHVSPSAEGGRTQNSQGLFCEGTLLFQEKSRAREKV